MKPWAENVSLCSAWLEQGHRFPFHIELLAFRWLKMGGFLSASAVPRWKKDFNCKGKTMLNRMKKVALGPRGYSGLIIESHGDKILILLR